MATITTASEEFPVVFGLPLRLSFTPDALREHFEIDEEMEPLLDRLSEDEIAEAGAIALQDDRLYETFHEVLCDAIQEVSQ